MERESFEDGEVAALLNEHFVAVKVDREERPDIDNVYMRVCQALTGAGGWPLTVLLTPDKQAFFAGTYFPKRGQYGRMGLMELLMAVAGAWQQDRAGLAAQAAKVTDAVLQAVSCRGTAPGAVTKDLIGLAYQELLDNFDETYGGFGGAPKFPTPHTLIFLLAYWHRTGEEKALAMVEKTLTSMFAGGIYDHLGGGFSRYSTDRQWLTPHFEKMLYDNALLLYVYAQAYQCSGKDLYARIVKEVAAYVKRDMTDVSGGFYSAEDADSEGVEGKFYVFTQEEIKAALGEEHSKIFCAYYGVTAAGNFAGKNILNIIGRDEDGFLKRYRLSRCELEDILQDGRRKLLFLREGRVKPHKDDKILTSWNALMIAALAYASRALAEPAYLAMAKRAAAFIEAKLMREGRLYVRYREGETAVPAYIDEYAFLLWAYLELYESSYDAAYLAKAEALAAAMRRLFYDEAEGGFYFSSAGSEVLLARQKEFYDGAIPSGNSVAIWSLQRLAALTGNEEDARVAERSLLLFADTAAKAPIGYTFFLLGAMQKLWPVEKFTVSGLQEAADTQALLRKLQQKFMPHAMVLFKQEEGAPTEATLSICRDFCCLLPLKGEAALKAMDEKFIFP